MEISNKSRTKKIKRNFNLIVFAFVIAALFFVWKEKDIYAIFVGAGLVIFIVLMLVINFNYVSFSSVNGKISVKYYPVITLMGREYSSIDFQQELLHSYKLQVSSVFSDLTLTVKTKKGVADYPQVSLTALKREEIEHIREELERILS